MRDTPVRNSALRSQRVVGRGAPLEQTKLRVDVVAIFGPTASGKSAVAAVVADRLGSEVISADALQVYRGLEILTNQSELPARLVGIRELTESMSVGEYAALAHDAIDGVHAACGVAVVAGGTGLYFRAALADIDIPPAVADDARRRAEETYDTDADAAYALLQAIDPAAAARVHANDRRRVVRALELADAGTSSLSSRDALWSEETRRPTLIVGLEVSPAELERRIVVRTDEMIERGAAEEARAALERPLSRTARVALGLDELSTLTLAEARERLVVRTRQYAAYQRKWMRRIPGLVGVNAERAPEEVADEVLELARSR